MVPTIRQESKCWPQDTDSGYDVEIYQQPGGAEFYRYTLAEMFGASLLGSGINRPRSAGILCYRGYVATARSDLMLATDDALCLMMPACTLEDPCVIKEGRKRHLAAVCCMQKAIQDVPDDITGTVASSLELLFVEIFKPFSMGMENLLGGVVHLARTYLQHLTSSQTHVSIFLLIQLRQIMLLGSLTSRTPMPLPIETWQHLPHVSTLLPEKTEALLQLAVQLPNLLHSTNEICHSVSNSIAFHNALSSLLSLECSLVQWLVQYYPKLSDRMTCHHLTWLPGANRALDQDKGGVNCHRITFVSAQCQTLCYICLLLIYEALIDLSVGSGGGTMAHEYTAKANGAADTLCQLAHYFITDGDGLLSKALSVRAPLYFARQWYETNGHFEKAAWAYEQEEQVQKEVPFVTWQSLLPLSLVSMYLGA